MNNFCSTWQSLEALKIFCRFPLNLSSSQLNSPRTSLFSRSPGFRSPNLSWTGFFGSPLISIQRGCQALFGFAGNCLQAENQTSNNKARFIYFPLLRHHNCIPPVVQCPAKSYFIAQLSNYLLWMVKSSPCYHSMAGSGSPHNIYYFSKHL